MFSVSVGFPFVFGSFITIFIISLRFAFILLTSSRSFFVLAVLPLNSLALVVVNLFFRLIPFTLFFKPLYSAYAHILGPVIWYTTTNLMPHKHILYYLGYCTVYCLPPPVLMFCMPRPCKMKQDGNKTTRFFCGVREIKIFLL